MDVRILRISPIGTDFFVFFAWISSRNKKKSVPIGEIRKIRTSIRILIFQSKNCLSPYFKFFNNACASSNL
jgi:hypothetical protein